MKAILTFEADSGDSFDWDDIRKAANFRNAYLALNDIVDLLKDEYRKDIPTYPEAIPFIKKMINDVNVILEDNNINLTNDVR